MVVSRNVPRTAAVLLCLIVSSVEHPSRTLASEKPPSIETVRGYLMPFKCQFDPKAAHTRDCALRPECRITGYGLALDDGSFLQFDADGNKQTVHLLERTSKRDNLQAEGDGYRVGPLFHLRRLRLK